MKKTLLLFALFCAPFLLFSQPILMQMAPTYLGTSGSRAPNGTSAHTYFRGSTIVLASELTAGIPNNTTLTKFGFMYNVGANTAVTGNLKVYISNTTSTTYGNGTDWATISGAMTLVYNGPYTVPESTSPIPVDVTLTTPFTYTGAGLYVAYEWSSTGPFATTGAVYQCNNSLAGGIVMAASTTALPTTLNTTSAYRPCMRFSYNNPFTNDGVVLQVYTLGKLPIPFGTPLTIQAYIKNQGSDTLFNLPNTLSVTGANNFNCINFIDTLLPGDQKLITYDSFNPINIGLNNVTVSVPSDQNNANNSITKVLKTNANTYSYAQGSVPSGGVGFNSATGDFVAKFTTATSQSINQVDVNFSSGGQPFEIGIWMADGSGKPGALLYNSQTFTSTSGKYTVLIDPIVAVPAGSFFVGVRQTGTTNVSFSYQTEFPIRPNCFFYTSPSGATEWTDFAPNNAFRFMIEPKFALNNDVSVYAVSPTNTNQLIAGNPINIQASIINYGINNQSFIPVYYSVNGETPIGPVNFIGNILQNNTNNITFSGVNAFTPTEGGIYNIKVFTQLTTDQNPENDTLTLQYNILPTPITNYPYIQNFNESIGWRTSGLWIKKSAHSPIDETNPDSAFVADFYDTSSGTIGMLKSPIFNFANITTPKLDFYVAYRTYNTQDDSLQIWVSTDIGQSFVAGSPILYKKSYTSTPSLSTMNPNNAEFIPSASSDWRLETVDLSQFVGDSMVMIAFKGISANGNNCWIDQIRVYDYSLPVVSTSNPINITTNSLTIGGSIVSVGYGIIQKGICFSTTPYPTISNDSVVMGSGNGSFSGQISGLIPNTIYYFRAFAINELGVAYGEQIISLTLPPQSSIINGSTSVCAGEIGVVYSVNNIQGVVFNWTVPNGWIITTGQGTNSITVNIGNNSGVISVIPMNGSGSGLEINKSISVTNLPNQPSIISGNNNICAGSTNTYSIVNTSGLSYNWAIPNGWQIVSGQGTNSISVIAGVLSGDIIVSPINGCGAGISRNIFVNVSQIPSQPSIITGSMEVCNNQNNLIYSVINESGINYNWTIPLGWILSSGQGTNSVTVYSGTNSGTISVTPSNMCGTGTNRDLNVITIDVPAQPIIVNCPTLVCPGSQGITYTVNNVINTNYNWVLPSGWNIVSGQDSNSITINVGTNTGTISVTPSNTCGVGIPTIINVDFLNVPSQPSEINGLNEVCSDNSGISYSVVNDTNTAYSWLVPSDWIIMSGQGTNSIVVHTGLYSGVISVTPANICGFGNSRFKNVTTYNPPEQPSLISGPLQFCNGMTGLIYTVNNEPNVNYNWTLPSDWIITSGQGTNSITVTAGAMSGNISVTPSNNCGNGLSRTINVSALNAPDQPSVILGAVEVCSGNSGITYSVINDTNVSYNWVVPSDWNITSGQGTNSIIVTVGSLSGSVSVTPSNLCGNGLSRNVNVTILNIPAPLSAISGPDHVCSGNSGITYSVNNEINVSYNWIIPSDWNITSGQGTNLIIVTVGSLSGSIIVSPSNSCGNGAPVTAIVTIDTIPSLSNPISGENIVCEGVNQIEYSVDSIPNLLYSWETPSGWQINSGQGTNSVLVTPSVNSGEIKVTPNNNCGAGIQKLLWIDIIPKPSTPIISYNGSLLESNVVNGNQWYNDFGMIDNAIQQSYIPLINSNYYTIITENNCKSDTSNKINVNNVNIDSFLFLNSIKVYPNPFSDKIEIESQFNTIVKIMIFDLQGKLLKDLFFEKQVTINLSDLSEGMYVIKFINGKSEFYTKIVKH